MTDYFDHFQAGDPGLVECDNPAAVYAKKRLHDGTWQCLVTQAQKDRLGAAYCPFSLAPDKCKGTGIKTVSVDGVDVPTGYPKGAPVHVFGHRVVEPGKHYKPGSSTPIADDQGEDEDG